MEDFDPMMRPEPLPEDADRALRPQALDEFTGQAEARANLRVFIQSARQRAEAMDHTLFYGPPGLGKTTLARTGPDVILKFTPNSRLIIWANVVFPRPGGP